MTTFLEFVCERLIGPPARQLGNGDSYWCCPLHNDTTPSFHTLPIHPKYRQYWKCFGCGKGGDEYQLLRELRDLVGHPLAMGTFSDHQALVGAWREEFDRMVNGSTEVKRPARLSSSVEALNPATVELAYANLQPDDVAKLAGAVALAKEHCADADGLLWLCYHKAREAERGQALVASLKKKGRR